MNILKMELKLTNFFKDNTDILKLDYWELCGATIRHAQSKFSLGFVEFGTSLGILYYSMFYEKPDFWW